MVFLEESSVRLRSLHLYDPQTKRAFRILKLGLVECSHVRMEGRVEPGLLDDGTTGLEKIIPQRTRDQGLRSINPCHLTLHRLELPRGLYAHAKCGTARIYLISLSFQ